MGHRQTRTSELGTILGSATGGTEQSIVAGGWAGTDDATSTALSDQLGNPPTPEEEKSFDAITRDFDERVRLDEEAQAEEAGKIDEIFEREEQAETD